MEDGTFANEILMRRPSRIQQQIVEEQQVQQVVQRSSNEIIDIVSNDNTRLMRAQELDVACDREFTEILREDRKQNDTMNSGVS